MMNPFEFQETSNKKVLNKEQNKLLSRKINELSLKIQGTCLEGQIAELYQELEQAGISFKPKTYLSDEWGCPQGVPVIGIPFYLADPGLCQLEGELTGIEAETVSEVMMCLRHEAGHAFNYAYRLYQKTTWRKLFGTFARPYKEVYKPTPFSSRFVHHIPGWYAQKHPDEDFAETFAVWLSPGSEWKRKYAGTAALAKLLYVDRVVRLYGRKPPLVTDDYEDKPVAELNMTLDDWYETNRPFATRKLLLHNIIDDDLRKLFPETEGQTAADILQANSKRLIRDVNHWTGIDRQILTSLLNELTARVRSLDLKIGLDQTTTRMVSVAIFLTTMVMNFQFKGKFIDA
jgi:hypothetical protein